MKDKRGAWGKSRREKPCFWLCGKSTEGLWMNLVNTVKRGKKDKERHTEGNTQLLLCVTIWNLYLLKPPIHRTNQADSSSVRVCSWLLYIFPPFSPSSPSKRNRLRCILRSHSDHLLTLMHVQGKRVWHKKPSSLSVSSLSPINITSTLREQKESE